MSNKKTRFFVILFGFILLASVMTVIRIPEVTATQPNTVIDYPGTYPGVAVGSLGAGNFELQNDILDLKWNFSGSNFTIAQFTDKMTSTNIALGAVNLFSLTLQDNTVITPANMTLTSGPSLSTLTGNPNAVRMAERDNGKMISATFHYSGGSLVFDVNWSITLRDGNCNAQQKFVITPTAGSFNLKYAKLIDVTIPGASIKGADNGQTVIAGNVFMGIENPMAIASINGNNVGVQVEKASEVISVGTSLTYTASVGLVPANQLRRGFLYYVERERVHYRRPYLTYISWFDLVPSGGGQNDSACTGRINTIGTQMVSNRSVVWDAFLWDDNWDNVNGLVWNISSTAFPSQFANMKSAVTSYGSSLGVWYSPFGGYGSNASARLAANPTMEQNGSGFMMSGPNYNSRVKTMSFDMVDNQGVTIFKIDGIGGGLYQAGPSSTNRKDYEYEFKYLLEMRAHKPDVFLYNTVGTWSSPYWFWFTDAIYRDSSDQPYALGGNSRQQLISGRDLAIYQYNVQQNPLHPISELMSHGFVFTNDTVNGTPASTNLSSAATQAECRDDMRWYFASGFALEEMYISPPAITNSGNSAFFWDNLAKYAKWGRTNINILTDSHMIGYPGNGGIYGYASWSSAKAILALRNPYATAYSISVNPQTFFELPAGAAPGWQFTEIDGLAGAFSASATMPYNCTVQPYSVLVFEAVPTVMPTPTPTPTLSPGITPSPTPTPTAPAGNLVSGRIASSSATFLNISRVTDGDKTTANYADSYPNDYLQWIQLDIGNNYNLNDIKIWHYFGDTRSYHDVIVRLSNTADFSSGVTTVFNNDTNNSAGLGTGADAEYTETSGGKDISFSQVNARYVRLYSNGSTANNSNHYVEVEVYATNGGPTPTATRTPTPTTSGGLPAPKAQWNFDETSGSTAADASGNGYIGTVTSGTWVAGKHNNALSFNGASSYVSCGTGPVINGTGGFSVSAWIKTSGTNMSIIQQRDAATNGYQGEYQLLIDANGKVNWYTYGTSSYGFNITSVKTVNNGVWRHITGVRETNGTGKIYIDGALDSSATGTVYTLNTLNVYIGADKRDNNKYFNGVIDDTRIYNSALTATQVTALAQ